MQFIKNKNCEIWFMGGLGNQLFQLNYGNWLTKELGVKVEFNTYLLSKNYVTKFLKWSIHEFFLESLINLDCKIIKNRNIPAILMSQLNIFKTYSKFSGLDEIPKKISNNLFGYFQNRNFLSSTQNNIKLKTNLLDDRHRYDAVMHLRSGDMNNKNYANSYYFSVLELLPPSRIHIVSDYFSNINYLKNNFRKHELINIGINGKEDFITCCNARKLIIAPSTFSWWAARLGRPNEIIIPKQIYQSLGSPILRKKVNKILV